MFYTLPAELLLALRKELKQSPDAETLEFELRLTAAHSNCDGYVDGVGFNSAILRNRPGKIPEWINPLVTGGRKIGSGHSGLPLRAALRAAKAYAGWLLTNPAFISEYVTLWNALGPIAMADRGVPRLTSDVGLPSYRISGWNVAHSLREAPEIRALREFCSRWRLAQLEGPLLPRPSGYLPSATLPFADVNEAGADGYCFVAFLDTQPLLPGGLLRQHLAELIGYSQDKHLQDWYSIIDAKNAAKASIEKYARIFEVQHYYRVLMSRHHDALEDQLPGVGRAFAGFLRTGPKTIGRLLKSIAARLGSDEWWKRPPISGE